MSDNKNDNKPTKDGVIKSKADRHDRFFKHMMGYPDVQRQFLHAHLPREIAKITDFSSLKIENTSYINEELDKYLSDVVVSGKFNGKAGSIHFLLEHQSSNDALMPLRIHEYMIEIYREFTINNPKAKTLPVVFPIIVSNTDGKFAMKLSLAELIDEPSLMQQVFKKFQAVDLNTISDNELATRVWSGILELTLKRRTEEFIIDIIESNSDMFRIAAIENKGQIISCLRAMICYNEGKTRAEDKPKLRGLLGKILDTEINEEIMQTLGDVYRAEALQEGVQQGLEQGAESSKVAIAKNMLAEGDYVSKIARCTGLSVAEIGKLKITK